MAANTFILRHNDQVAVKSQLSTLSVKTKQRKSSCQFGGKTNPAEMTSELGSSRSAMIV